MRKIFLPWIMIFLALSGCKPEAESVVKNYYNALGKGNFNEAYNFLSTPDKKLTTLEEYKGQQNSPMTKAFIAKTSYEIVRVEENGDKAVAIIKTTGPDEFALFKGAMGVAFKNVFSKDDNKEENMEKDMANLLNDKSFPIKTAENEVKLIKEESGWKISLGLEQKQKIAELMKEAEKLKSQKKLPSALDKYNEVLSLDSNMVEAKKASEETKKDIESFADKQAYVNNIELYDLKGKYYESLLDGKVPGVDFKLRNKGNRTLKEVEVTVYFKDKDGNVIAEQQYHPVLMSSYSFGDNNKPLKPNYIWQMEQGRFYQAKSVPSEWQAGAVSAKITDIEFME